MPRKTIAFACEHGCGRNLLVSRSRMEAHETRCFFNPETKSCATCGNFDKATRPIDEYEPPEAAGCDAGIDITKRLVTGCAAWKQRKEGV